MINSSCVKFNKKDQIRVPIAKNAPITEYQIRPPIKYEEPRKREGNRSPFARASKKRQDATTIEGTEGGPSHTDHYTDGKRLTLTLDLNSVIANSEN